MHTLATADTLFTPSRPAPVYPLAVDVDGDDPSALLAEMPRLVDEAYAQLRTWAAGRQLVAELVLTDASVRAGSHDLPGPAFARVAPQLLVRNGSALGAWVLRGWYAPARRGEVFHRAITLRPTSLHTREVIVACVRHRSGELVVGAAPLLRPLGGPTVSADWRFLRGPGGPLRRDIRAAASGLGLARVPKRHWHYFEPAPLRNSTCLYCGVRHCDAALGVVGCEIRERRAQPPAGWPDIFPTVPEQQRLVNMEEKSRRGGVVLAPPVIDEPHHPDDWGTCVVCNDVADRAGAVCRSPAK